MDWSLQRCGRVGHVTYAPDEPHLREQMHSATASAELWQCLRCGTYVPGSPDGSGPAADAPRVKRSKQIRADFFLKLFAIERGIRVIIFGGVAYGIWRYANSPSIAAAIKRDIPIIRTFSRQLGFTLSHSLLEKIRSVLHLSSSNLRLVALGVTALAVVSAIEAFALWQAKRWGEYFAATVTSLGLPLEIYELAKAVNVTKLVLFALNLLLVFYLVYSRRLFGARGGKHSYEARLRAASVIDEAGHTAAALLASQAPMPTSQGGPPEPARAGPAGQAQAGPLGPVRAGAAGQAQAAPPVTPSAAIPAGGRPSPGSEPATVRRDAPRSD
jgi:uncharacterized membrane protein (DUF2068 family)